MKKIILVVAVMAMAVVAYAQPRAIGVRLGYGAEVSYEHSLGESNMIQLEVGVPGFAGVEAACTYNWNNPFGTQIPWNEKGEWNWYLGVGAAAGFWGWGSPYGFVGAAGRVGVEYRFWFPLELSVDFRPTLGAFFGKEQAGFYYDVYSGGLGISARYYF